MNFPFPIVEKYLYPKFEAQTEPDGIRVYLTPEGNYVPSVTTILGTIPKPALVAWRARIGDKKADQITKEACEVGSIMHDTLEGYVSAYLQGRPERLPVTDQEKQAHQMATVIRKYGLFGQLEQVWGIEAPLFCSNFYAGRTDLIGIYLGKPSIIDYKSTRRIKQESWIKSYKLQLAAYALAHEIMHGEDVIEQGVILMAVRPGANQEKPMQRFIIEKDELDACKREWFALVEAFWNDV